MRKIALIALALFSYSNASAQNLKGEAVILRALDKVTAITKDFTVAVGDSLNYGSLRVDVKHCEKRPPEEIPEAYVFLQIFDNKFDDEKQSRIEEKVFSGWMLKSNPAMSALDHGVYDIWVIGCKTPDINED